MRFLPLAPPGRAVSIVWPGVLLVLAALSTSCGGQGEAAESRPAGPTADPSGGSGGAPDDGGNQEDAKIDLSPDAGAPGQRAPFAGLCGSGFPCTPGEAECVGPKLDGGDSGDDTCQLFASADGTVAACVPEGPFGPNEPCVSAEDCKAGLGCVAGPGGGVCRPYCCGGVELCPAKTYCAAQPMAEDVQNDPPLDIPVCVPATNCQLLEDKATCPPGLTCTIVRADGTTSCVEPGLGQLGDPCECAAGFVCAKLTNTCKKLCHIGQDEADCPNGGTCQGGSAGYPDNIGVCVGGGENQY